LTPPRGQRILAEVVYKVSVRANPRILVLYLVIPALPAAAVLFTVLVDRTVGIIGLAIGAYVSYQLAKFLRSHLRSYIETGEEALRCRTTANTEIVLSWGSISHAGHCFPEKGPDYLFVYSEQDDKLLTIPKEYAGFDQLREEIRGRVGQGIFRELALTAEETLAGRLKMMLGE
jgi:hypothetical protein